MPLRAISKSTVLADILTRLGELHTRHVELIRVVWSEGNVVADWRGAVIIPIPKKGDLHQCDNRRGISLLDVVGKLFARIIQDRLQTIAESVLPDSQCSFRRDRGCMDMVHVACQLVENPLSMACHYALFVDLRKAYDSIPRPALWALQQKSGGPPTMLNIIKSLHESMQVKVRAGGNLTSNINNGLRQGCTPAIHSACTRKNYLRPHARDSHGMLLTQLKSKALRTELLLSRLSGQHVHGNMHAAGQTQPMGRFSANRRK